MTTKAFSTLANRLVPTVHGCPIPVITQYVRDAAIEACERTLAWRYIQPTIRLTPGVYDYPFELPDDTEVHAIISTAVNANPIRPVTLESAVTTYPLFPDDSATARATPLLLVHIDPDTFYVAPTPDAVIDYDLKMIVALKPLRDAAGMDTTIMDDLENVIIHGAAQNLLVLPEKPWSDRELAAYHAKQYVFKLTERRARVNVGSGRAVLTVRHLPLA